MEIIGDKVGAVVKRDFILPLQGPRTAMAFPLPVDSLQHDSYQLAIKVSDGTRKVETKKEFYIRWPGLPRNAKDLNLAIQQLQLISLPARVEKLKTLGEGKSNRRFFKLLGRAGSFSRNRI